MSEIDVAKEYYQAFVDKNTEYEGVFFVGVKTTGVFCRPTCRSKKPKFENCEFYETAQDALLASFRPCKRCHPLSLPNRVSKIVQTLVEAVEEQPEKRWREKDFDQFPFDASTARRQFKKRFGMTFVEYARARRMGLAMKQIRAGEAVIEAQLTAGYESSSGFREAFSRIMGAAPSKLLVHHDLLKISWLDTPLGPMIAVGDESRLYLLEFVDRRGLEQELEQLKQKTKSAIIPGHTQSIDSIEQELRKYFEGELEEFKTPIVLLGSKFQQRVWEEIKKIPFGETRTYSDIASSIGEPKSFRAVAKASSSNQFAIIIPCHRVIHTGGEIGNNGGGPTRKKWLLNLEKSNLLAKTT